ncbi:MAG: hypothetical protein IKO83_07665 [Oscillospiraceae bacterium]|nr:hypothetical protein [Oscillospiraceae bacterium]
MKRVLSAILILVIVSSLSVSCFADGKKFDYKGILGELKGYEYNKFDKYWSYYKAYVEKYSDANVVIGMEAWGVDGGSNLDYTQLYIKILNKSGDVMYIPESIDFLIGDDMYSYEELIKGTDSGYVYLGEQGNILIKALANCDPKEVAIRIGWGTGSINIDPDADDLKSTLRKFCRTYTKNNIWDYCDDPDWVNEWEEYFPLTVNGEPAKVA